MVGTLSILGLYNYDNTVLDGIADGLPDAAGITLDEVRHNILTQCAEIEVIISNPNLLKQMVTHWAKRKSRGWARYYAAIAASYNPLENYDRQESLSETESGTSGSTVETSGTTNETHDSTRTPNLTRENKVSAYNEATYQPHDQTTETGSDRDAGTRTLRNDADSESSGEFSRTNTKQNRIHGNIGVTTSQQMLISELDLVDRLDLIQKITDDFKREFCITLY